MLTLEVYPSAVIQAAQLHHTHFLTTFLVSVFFLYSKISIFYISVLLSHQDSCIFTNLSVSILKNLVPITELQTVEKKYISISEF